MADFKTTVMRFTSRASVKIKDSYFTFEATIEKQCPDEFTEQEYIEAKDKLWAEVNEEVNLQVNDCVEELSKPKK